MYRRLDSESAEIHVCRNLSHLKQIDYVAFFLLLPPFVFPLSNKVLQSPSLSPILYSTITMAVSYMCQIKRCKDRLQLDTQNLKPQILV